MTVNVGPENRPLRSEVVDGMHVDWDAPIPMDDGVVLRANVYRPVEPGSYPVLISYGPYGKDLSFQEAYPNQWNSMVAAHPEIEQGSSGRHQAWEVADPEKWVPHGYVIVRIDSRGAGRSPGRIDCFSPRETQDFYDCIEWAGVQDWSNGKVGLSGVSYYAVNQWQVAALQPPHLVAMCPWEGAADWYRDANFHGGVPSPFLGHWFEAQVAGVQHGLGSRGRVNPHSGILVAGDTDLSEEELASNRADLRAELREHPLVDDYWLARTADLSRISTPMLSSANWGGQGLHLRGNLSGYQDAASSEKWLEIHGEFHWTHYYTDYGVTLQRRFFDYYLKGEGDWLEQPRVALNVRHPGERFEYRAENEWPLARTEWTKLHFDLPARELLEKPTRTESSATYRAMSDGITLALPPFEADTEITGPLAAKFSISSSTPDTDLFLVLQLFDPDGKAVHFNGATEPKQPISQGWLRASHRALDTDRSTEHQPYHPHTQIEPLEPGEIYEVEVEIWPTCIVAPKGYRLGLTIQGADYDHGEEGVVTAIGELRGCGYNMHNDPTTRPVDTYAGEVTVHCGGDRDGYLLVPFIPPASTHS